MIRTTLSALLLLGLGAACTGGTGDGSDASVSPAADADPNAPDADPTPDAGLLTIDAGPPSIFDASTPPGSTINCGQDTCQADSEECCISGGGTATCVSIGNCGGTAASCDGPEDCTGGDVCCGTFSGIDCASTCEGNAGELCHTANDCSTAGDMCCDLGGVGISACAPSCMGGGFPAG